MSPLEKYTANVARRWKAIVLLAIVGAALAAAWFFLTSRTTWTATAALTTQSQERAPDQDAVLALGYVNYFNQDSYQELLRSRAPIPADVKLEAQTGATSPILYIMATGPSADATRNAAALAAETFREDVRTSLAVERRRAADDLQAQVDANVKLLGQRGYNESVVLDQIRSLQGRITDIQADNTNVLKQLQPEPGVASVKPNPVLSIAAGGAGGALLGVLISLLLGVTDRRLRTPADIERWTGLQVLADLSANVDAEARGQAPAMVVNMLSLKAGDGRIVLGVTTPRRTFAARRVAVDIARTVAGRSTGALLVLADLRRSEPVSRDPSAAGLVDILDGTRTVRSTAVVASGGLKVLLPGRAGGYDPQTALEPSRVVELVNAASELAGIVVIELPPVLEAAEAQVLGSATDRILLVVERGVTSAADVDLARRTLQGVGAILAGAVLVDAGSEAVDLLLPVPGDVPRQGAENGSPQFSAPAGVRWGVDAPTQILDPTGSMSGAGSRRSPTVEDTVALRAALGNGKAPGRPEKVLPANGAAAPAPAVAAPPPAAPPPPVGLPVQVKPMPGMKPKPGRPAQAAPGPNAGSPPAPVPNRRGPEASAPEGSSRGVVAAAVPHPAELVRDGVVPDRAGQDPSPARQPDRSPPRQGDGGEPAAQPVEEPAATSQPGGSPVGGASTPEVRAK